MRLSVVVATMAFLATTAIVQAEDLTIANPDQLKWAPTDLVPGNELAPVLGDPSKEGLVVMAWRGPAGSTTTPHWHSRAEQLTFLTGTTVVGMGDNIDLQKGATMSPGSFVNIPAKTNHWTVAKTPFTALVQIQGPFDMHFLDKEGKKTQ